VKTLSSRNGASEEKGAINRLVTAITGKIEAMTPKELSKLKVEILNDPVASIVKLTGFDSWQELDERGIRNILNSFVSVETICSTFKIPSEAGPIISLFLEDQREELVDGIVQSITSYRRQSKINEKLMKKEAIVKEDNDELY
jgi:hypothetical protein